MPASALPVTIGGCFLLTEDPDLSDPSARPRVFAWLQVAQAVASEVEYITGSAQMHTVKPAG